MRIAVCGCTDKRVILYSILKIIEPLGDVAFVSNNMQLSRLVNDPTNPDHIKNILGIVTELSVDEVWDAVQLSEDKFDYVLYDCVDTLPDNPDLVVVVKGTTHVDPEIADLIELIPKEIDTVLLKVCYDGRVDHDDWWQLPIDTSMFAFVEKFERYHKLGAVTSKPLQRTIAKLLGEPLDMPDKKIISLMKGGNRA